jgi:protoheme IX farnesyltransferase
MLPLIDAAGRRTAGVAVRNALYMLPLGFVACALGVTTPPFAWEAAALSACLAGGAAAFYARPAQASARRLFLLSLVHLPALQLACVVHRVPNTADARTEAPGSLAEWSQRHRAQLASDSSPPRQEVIRGALAGGLAVAPFPMLPLPRGMSLSCPSRAACQGGEALEAPASGVAGLAAMAPAPAAVAGGLRDGER